MPERNIIAGVDLLVEQKNAILSLINENRLTEATAVLAVLQPLWESEGYGYKLHELQARIAQETSILG